MSGINFAAFKRDGTRDKAMGISGSELPNGGIIDPEEIPIPTGTTLIRFGGFPKMYQREIDDYVDGGAHYFGPQVASGEWWLDWENYLVVQNYADLKRESVTFALRETCAVPLEWSDMSFVVQATSRSPLLAYKGYGRAANIRDKAGKLTGRINPSAGDKPLIKQLFIPGLNSPDLMKRAIFVHGKGFLDKGMSEKGARRKAEEDAARLARLKAATQRR